jgi:mannosyl-oligosaccharide glucosidase
MVNASVLIVSDFGRYTKELASLKKDVVAPYVHVVDSFLNDDPSDPFEARPTLLFFRGRTVRKDVCNQFLKPSILISSFSPAFIVVKFISRVWHLRFLFQEGKIRAKLAKILKDKDGVRFEDSLATGDGIKTVSISVILILLYLVP